MGQNNQARATYLLLIVAVGFLGSYPFHTTFWGGLISSMCSAALVGGLADWFAVTALFRRPLGLHSSKFIRTEIIPRNRERIMNSLVDMVEKELLTKENLQRRIGDYDLAKLFLVHLEEHGGKQQIKVLLNTVINELLTQMDVQEAGHLVSQLIKSKAAQTELSPLLAETLEWTLQNGYDDKIITLLLDEIMHFINYQQLHTWISLGLSQAMRRYEKGLKRRELVNNLILNNIVDNPSPQFQAELRKLLNSLLSNLHVYLRQSLSTLNNQLKQDQELREKVEVWKSTYFETNTKLQLLITELIQMWQHSETTQPKQIAIRTALINDQVDKFVVGFAAHKQQQEWLNRTLRFYLYQLIDQKHHEIGNLVRERLSKFTDELLVNFIESKAGNDLQMIRINGTAVGGITGLLIFLTTFWLS